jgi:hypothetical protein
VEEKYITAIIALVGVLVGLLVRDILMQLILLRKKREQNLEDRRKVNMHVQHESFWHYATPLLRSVDALKYRLIEIADEGPATYLLADAPDSDYVNYKKISTLYRIASVLGWVRAYRKERSYLSDELTKSSNEFDKLFSSFESSLADGHHIEDLRFQELVKLWSIPARSMPSVQIQHRIASEVDLFMDQSMIAAGKLSVAALHHTQQISLCKKIASHIAGQLSVSIPDTIVMAELKRAVAFLDIKELYIYRDWQSAIGDLMLKEIDKAPRRFDVIGYGEFEARYMAAKGGQDGTDKIWFDRLEGLIHDLDMRVTGIFDARREQINNMYKDIVLLSQSFKDLLDKHREFQNIP